MRRPEMNASNSALVVMFVVLVERIDLGQWIVSTFQSLAAAKKKTSD